MPKGRRNLFDPKHNPAPRRDAPPPLPSNPKPAKNPFPPGKEPKTK